MTLVVIVIFILMFFITCSFISTFVFVSIFIFILGPGCSWHHQWKSGRFLGRFSYYGGSSSPWPWGVIPTPQLLLLYFGVSGGGEDGWRALEW